MESLKLNRSLVFAVTTVLVLIMCSLFSSKTLGDEALYQARCVACHQVDGSGNTALQSPAIFALDEAYVKRQLTHFRSGLRGGAEGDPTGAMMAASATGLTDTQLSSLSQYIASMELVPLKQELASAGFRGRGLYSGCGSCHGSEGEGYPELGAPRIAAQYSWYIQRQLKNFRGDVRGAPGDDTFGQQMRVMAKAIANEQDIVTLANHIAAMSD